MIRTIAICGVTKICTKLLKCCDAVFSAPKFVDRILSSDVFELNSRPPLIYWNRVGFQFAASSPLKTFKPPIIKMKGKSTPADGCGGYWLKASLKTPLSTSGVHNCAVCVLVNSKTKEHFLYHVYVGSPVDLISDTIKKVMGKDFDKAFIVPGHVSGTQTTSCNILEAVKKLNPCAVVEYRHVNKSDTPEIVAYKSEMFEIPFNRKSEKHLQASFIVVKNPDE